MPTAARYYCALNFDPLGVRLIHLIYLHFAGIQLLLAQVLSQSVPVTGFLFACKLPQCVVSDGGVVAGHTQGAAPLAGHAGEALPPGEVIHRHQIKTYPFPPW